LLIMLYCLWWVVNTAAGKSMASEVQWSDARVAQLDEVLRSLNDRLGMTRR